MKNHEQWWDLKAWNAQSQYGYGTRDEADRYCELLNKGREINLYAPYEVDNDRIAALDSGQRDDGFTLSEALAD